MEEDLLRGVGDPSSVAPRIIFTIEEGSRTASKNLDRLNDIGRPILSAVILSTYPSMTTLVFLH